MLKIGAVMFFTSYSMQPVELGLALEERGFESIWVPEHTHIPSSRKTPYPAGGPLIRPYYDIMDPFLALTAIAAATRTLRLGTGIALITQRDPIVTAKMVSTLDQLSGGRFLFGVGNGWNQDEIENHGTVFADRHKIARERIEAMQAIWTRTEPEYHGEFVDFGPMRSWPKPVQVPHPPVIVGGAYPWGAKRAIRYGNGWMPHRVRKHYADVGPLVPEFHKLVTESGRRVEDLPITIWGVKEDRDALLGDRDLGVERVILSLESARGDVILPQLDRWAALIQAVA